MARSEIVTTVCDLPHPVNEDLPEGRPFGVSVVDARGRRQQYAVDLCEQHARKTVQLLILNGRKVK